MNKHLVKIAVLTAIVMSSLATITPALAAPSHGGGGSYHGGARGGSYHGGGGHGGGRGYGGWGLGLGIATGVLIGSELAYPYYYPYPYPDAYGPVVLPPESYISAPPVQVAPSAPPAAANVWYYCESAQAYYPYTSNCAEGWKIVPATPPAQ